ncbi:MAG: 3-deoxy-D-manno-octulosonic acid transferase [Caulobacteraceae bacterium]|nr:3-deoxy-D-manno-octulosonic acid transferase [Caulobacteraceae bacterium]
MNPERKEALPLSLAAYGAAAAALAPLATTVLSRRARRGKEDPVRLGERLGRASVARPPGGLVWLHAVSVGESLSLLPLVERLAADRPDLGLLVTTGTRASAEVLGPRLPAGVIHQFAPVDTPGAVRRFLDHWRPDLGLFVESELWPNLILQTRARGAKLALVSARITERSYRAWSRWPSAIRKVLGAFELVLPQDAASEARLVSLGARPAGRLNLKRAAAPLLADGTEVARLRAAAGPRPIVAAVSTHAPEEAMIARVMGGLAGRPPPLLILAPRHPQRGETIASELAPARVARRSAGDKLDAQTEIYLADTLGEIGLVLRLADVAVMGGSFGEGIGGHNPLEPARLGAPAVSGPDVSNFADLYEDLVAAGAALVAADPPALVETLDLLLGDHERRRAMGEAAIAFAGRQAGQLEAALALIGPLLP